MPQTPTPVDINLFLHVRVLIGIILRLSVTSLVGGIAGFIQHPGRHRVSLIHLGWVAWARVARIYYPLNFRIYHQATIAWQLRKMMQFKPKHIAYHLPTKEYHDYVNALEENLGMSLKPVHESLDSFVQTLINYINAEADDETRKKMEFIVPYNKSATHPYESYSFPYKFPEKFGINKEEAFGIGHLAEVSAAYTAWKQDGGDPVPVLVVVMRDDYYDKKLIDTERLDIL